MFRTLLFTVSLGIVLFIVSRYTSLPWLHEYVWFILVFFLGISFMFHRLIDYGMRNNREKFVKLYMATIVGRLILSVVFIGSFLYAGLNEVGLFVINFFALYLLYTGFEIYGLYRNLRPD